MKKSKTFIPFNLQSLTKSNTADANGDIDYVVKGYASTGRFDTQGEKMLQEGIDWNTYKSFRRLKYEHDGHPAVNIGYVEKVDPGTDKTFIEARIFAKAGTEQHKLAKSVVDDLQNSIEYKKSHPNAESGDVGFSVEGGKLVKSNGEIPKAIVTHVVMTYAPANTDCKLEKSFTISDLAKSFNKKVLDSELPGESIDNFKILNMKKSFKTGDEIRKFYTDLNFDEADINLRVQEWKDDDIKEKALTKSFETLEADVATLVNTAKETIDGFTKGETFETMSKSFKDSQTLDPTTGKMNPMNVLVGITNMFKSLVERIESHQKSVANLLSDKIKVDAQMVTMMKSNNEKLNSVLGRTDTVMDANSMLAKSLKRLETSSVMENLEEEIIEDPNNPNGGAGGGNNPTKEKYEPEVLVNMLKSMSKNFFDAGKKDDVSTCTKILSTGRLVGFQFSKLDPECQAFIENNYNKK